MVQVWRVGSQALQASLGLGLLALATLVPGRALAQPPPPPPPPNFFTDAVGVVSGAQAAQIESRLRELERSSSNQLLVVVGDHVPEGYASLEEYTARTAEAWRVGDKARDNGAVLFVFVGDRKVRIEVGYGLEGALPDALASRIINDEITPRFRAGNYGEGLLAGVDAIIQATRGEYRPVSRSSSSGRKLLIVLLILLFSFVGVLVPVWREIMAVRGYRTYSGRGASRGRSTSHSGWGGGWSGGGGSRGGGGGFSGGGGGGGFSGGGGSFGGGGASGRW